MKVILHEGSMGTIDIVPESDFEKSFIREFSEHVKRLNAEFLKDKDNVIIRIWQGNSK